jgi:hypothetical protein
MQLTIDIPEPLYIEMRSQAQRESKSVEEVFIQRAASGQVGNSETHMKSGRIKLPLIVGGDPGPLLHVGVVNLNDFMFATDDELEDLT